MTTTEHLASASLRDDIHRLVERLRTDAHFLLDHPSPAEVRNVAHGLLALCDDLEDE